MSVTYVEVVPEVEQYMNLIESTGWQGIIPKGHDKLEVAITNSWYVVSAYINHELIGFGRIISDGVVYAFICDLIIIPEHQGKGIGSHILKMLLMKCQEQDIRSVQLFSAKHKSKFYQKYGFVERENDAPGMVWLKKDLN